MRDREREVRFLKFNSKITQGKGFDPKFKSLLKTVFKFSKSTITSILMLINYYYYMAKIEITTKLWKRSKESGGTTIPKVVLQGLELDKSYKVKWDFDRAKGKWFVGFEET